MLRISEVRTVQRTESNHLIICTQKTQGRAGNHNRHSYFGAEMRTVGIAFALVLVLACSNAQIIDDSDLQTIISGYTDGSDGSASQTYLTTLATTLATGFTNSIGGVIQESVAVIQNPSDWSSLYEELEDKFCEKVKLYKSTKKPARIVGPEIDIEFSGGACLLNETAFLSGNGDLTVDCIAPSVSVEIKPAKLSAPYKNATYFEDKECKIEKDFGEESDKVVYVLDKGVFDINGLVQKMTTDLTAVLGQFSDEAGSVVSSPGISPILQTVNAATSLLG